MFYKISSLIFQKLEKVVVIDAGHGSIDPGATYNGLKEKDINLQVAFLFKEIVRRVQYKSGHDTN